MNKAYWTKWLKVAGIRALRTAGQVITVMIPTTAIYLSEIDWKLIGSTVVLTAVLSLGMSLKGLPELNFPSESEAE